MKQILLLVFVVVFTSISTIYAQGLQPGECGVRFTYDAAGNLTLREYICNNSGVVIYRGTNNIKDTTVAVTSRSKATTDDLIAVSSIMPNPTSGRFTVVLSQPLNNYNVLLLDVNGKVLEKRKESGNTLSFDIGSKPAGIYFVRIEGNGRVSTFKVLKQ